MASTCITWTFSLWLTQEECNTKLYEAVLSGNKSAGTTIAGNNKLSQNSLAALQISLATVAAVDVSGAATIVADVVSVSDAQHH